MAIEYAKTNLKPFLYVQKQEDNDQAIPLTPDFGEFSLLGYNSADESIDTLDFAKELLNNKNWAKKTTQNFDGDEVTDFDINEWSPKQYSSIQYVDSNKVEKPNYNVDKAVEESDKTRRTKSIRLCAKYVRKYLQAGGINMDDRPRYAGQYYAYFKRKKEWTQINPSDVQKGDVCVTVNNGYGHLAFYNGNQWISDFRQRGPHVYSYSKDGQNTFYFRYTG